MHKWLMIFTCLLNFGFTADKMRVYEEQNPSQLLLHTSEPQEISHALGLIGVRFEQWETNKDLPLEFDPEKILRAYSQEVSHLMEKNGYQSVDVVRMFPDSPQKSALREKFLNEHTHSEDEVRFFVEGSGLFYLHVDKKIYVVLCEKGDLISIPAGYLHWFDMGEQPRFAAIRFFTEPTGWIAHFTESGISKDFPKME